MKKERDYGIDLAIIVIWLMVGGFAQCESARNLDGIRQELSGIEHELFMLRHK